MNTPVIDMPNARFKVTRADNSVEFDAATDGYAILCEQARQAVVSLGKMDAGKLHSRDVLGILVTIKDKGAASGDELTPSVCIPADPELAGALLFGALLAVRMHSPAAFAKALGRLADAGVLTRISR